MYRFPEVPSKLNQAAKLEEVVAGEAVAVDILVGGQGEPIIYKGDLLDYHLGEKNTIKYLILSNVSRREMSKNPEDLGKLADETISTKDKRFYAIPGDAVVFKGEHIINFNIRLIRLDLTSQDDIYAIYGEPKLA